MRPAWTALAAVHSRELRRPGPGPISDLIRCLHSALVSAAPRVLGWSLLKIRFLLSRLVLLRVTLAGRSARYRTLPSGVERALLEPEAPLLMPSGLISGNYQVGTFGNGWFALSRGGQGSGSYCMVPGNFGGLMWYHAPGSELLCW